MKFKDIKLHDAILNSVQTNPLARTVEISGVTFGAGSAQFKLQFTGVSFTQMPLEGEWIKPNSVEQLMTDDENEFIIQMKNGLIIEIRAKEFNFETNI